MKACITPRGVVRETGPGDLSPGAQGKTSEQEMSVMTHRTRKSGFTLVEILIVVIILGILAAIVIPQFTSASQDARKNSLVSQLQTIKAQLELARLQHLDKDSATFAAGGAATVSPWVPGPWADMLVKTNSDYTTTGTPNFGPYLQAPPVNP